jgi:phosphoheptose isomerase
MFEKEIEKAASKIAEGYKISKAALFCGNGGSAADCEHCVGELLKEFKIFRPLDKDIKEKLGMDLGEKLRGGIPAISLVSQISYLTAECNDVGFEYVYAQQVIAYKDIANAIFCFSTSGNSKAVCNAAMTAKALGITVIGFTGESGGKLKPLCDICFNVDETETYRVQEKHLALYHKICSLAEEKIWKK